MNDKTPAPAAPTPGAAPDAGRFAIVTQYIKDLSFESPNAPSIFAVAAKTQPQIGLNIDVTAQRMQGRLAEVVMRLRVDAKVEEKVAFIMELDYAALCSIDTSASIDATERFLCVDAAQLLFPYVRHLVSSHIREAGYQPLLLQPIDFGQLYEKRKAAGQLVRTQPPAPGVN